MSKREFTVVVIPHSGRKTIERRFSVLGFRVLVVLASVLLLAATVTVILAVRIHVSKAEYLSLKARNAGLEAKLAKVGQLESELQQMKAEDDRIRGMLGIDQQPPKLDLERLYDVLAQDTGAFLDSAAIRMLDTLRGQPPNFPAGNWGVVPSIPPINGFTISRGYGSGHPGIDLVAESGTPVMATARGVVVFAGWDTVYGNSVQIQHPGRFRTLYGHLLRIARLAGDSVQQGDLIGLVGSTGRSTAPHLHYEVLKDGKQVDPQQYFQ